MSLHSKLPPSSAARRIACPGSRALEEKYKSDKKSPAALEGEAAHWAASEYLKFKIEEHPRSVFISSPHHENGEVITQEMLDCAKNYADYVLKIAKGSDIHIEEPVDISVINPACFGTPDCWFFCAAHQELHIFDYKYGFGVVEVFENWQMIEYAAGILNQLFFNKQLGTLVGTFFQSNNNFLSVKVIFHVIQPRAYHKEGCFRTWATTGFSLFDYFTELKDAERLAMQENALCHPSLQCNNCAARHACPALQQSALTVVDVSLENTPLDLPAFSLANELRFLKRAAKLLDARITGLEVEAVNLLQAGKRLPFFHLESSATRERWKKSNEEIVALGELLGIDLKKSVSVITPKQAINAGIPDNLVRNFSEKPAGTLKLILDDNCNEARKLFSNKLLTN